MYFWAGHGGWPALSPISSSFWLVGTTQMSVPHSLRFSKDGVKNAGRRGAKVLSQSFKELLGVSVVSKLCCPLRTRNPHTQEATERCAGQQNRLHSPNSRRTKVEPVLHAAWFLVFEPPIFPEKPSKKNQNKRQPKSKTSDKGCWVPTDGLAIFCAENKRHYEQSKDCSQEQR